jgi:predicted nucleic acid-binding Zn ribbon protein
MSTENFEDSAKVRELIQLVEQHQKGELSINKLPYKTNELEPVMSEATINSSSSLAGALDALLDRLGAETTTAITGVFGEWPKIVGEQVAQHVTPIKLERGRLIVEIDDPSWATQMRFLEPQLVEKLNTATTSTITSIEVRVKRNPRNR